MPQTIKIVIPMAGHGTRMRPHTWSKPKPLIKVAGKTVLDYLLAQFDTLPESFTPEYVLITGGQGEQIQAYIQAHHPDVTVDYVTQAEMRGQSHALYLARQHLHGPMLMCFSDTLLEIDLAFLEQETADGVAVAQRVPDPRRFGSIMQDADGWVSRLIEKSQDMTQNLVVVGFYYFASGAALLAAIEEQMQRNLSLKGEFFIVEAINIMIDRGAKFGVRQVATWLDAGTPEAILDTNRYLLAHGNDNSAQAALRPGVAVIPPVYIHETASVQNSVIGPNVSIGAGCLVNDSVLRDCIIDDRTEIRAMLLEKSLLGSQGILEGHLTSLNLGDDACLKA